MAEKTVEIKLIASDQASTAIQRVQRITQEAGQVMERTTGHTSKLQRQWEGLTSASEYLAGGIKKVKNILEGFMWGTIIGIVSTVVARFIDYVTHSRISQQATEELEKAVRSQAEAWKLLPDKIHQVSRASVELYNAQLRQAQFLERNKGRELQEGMSQQEAGISRLREVVKNSQRFAWPLDKSVVETIARGEVKLAELRKEYENWQRLMSMTPATLSQVKSNLEKTGAAIDKVTENLLDKLSKIKHLEPTFEPMLNAPNMNLSDSEIESLQRRVALMDAYNKLQAQSVSGIYDRITASAALGDITVQEQQAMLLSIEAMKVRNAMFSAGVSAVQQAILGQQQFGKALKMALAQTMAQVAAEAAVRSIFEAAMGFANLWKNPAAASAHFKAAGLFAAVGVAAGVAARSVAGGATKNTTSSNNSNDTSTSALATPQPQSRNVTIQVFGNIVDHAAFVRELQPYFKEVAVDTV